MAILLAAGVLVFFVRLGTASWTFDEFFFGVLGVNFLHDDFDQTVGVHPLPRRLPHRPGAGRPRGGGTGVVRVAAATAGLATAGVLFLFARRVAGPRAAIAAAAWIVVPHAAVMGDVPLAAVKIERFGVLDPFMVLFGAAALRRMALGGRPRAGRGPRRPASRPAWRRPRS